MVLLQLGAGRDGVGKSRNSARRVKLKIKPTLSREAGISSAAKPWGSTERSAETRKPKRGGWRGTGPELS